MQLTAFTDYALRTLMYAGLKDRLITIQEVAETYDISRNHLMKIVQFLGEEGLLENRRGKNGGFRLAADPAAVNLGHLIRRTEGNLYLVDCFNEEAPACRIRRSCKLQSVLADALEAFFSVLDGYTLADLLTGRRGLARDLGIA